MFCFVGFSLLVVFVSWGDAVRYVPFTPCPELFNYFESQSFEVFGAMTFKNDFSGSYDLEVNMSIATTTDKNIAISRRTEEYNIQQGQGIEYYVHFPFNHTFPKVTSIKFNGKTYCTGPPEVANDEHGVSALSATNHFSTTISEEAIKRRNRTTTTTTTTPAAPHTEVKVKEDDVQCGINIDYKPLSFGGLPTRSGEYPWLVALFIVQEIGGYTFICGGSLVSKKHVITAAHCMRDNILSTNIPTDELVVVLGKHNIKNWVRGGTIRGVKNYYIHPEFRKPADADIAVLVLDEPVTYGVTIRAICFWDEDDKLDNIVENNGTVAGWGKDESGLNWLEEPKQIQLPIVSQQTCLWSDVRYVKLTSARTFCAGNVNQNRGPCSGDSGSGFVMNRDGIWKLRGIVSIALLNPSTRICDVNNYIVFSDVPKYMDWVKRVMGH